MHVSLKSSVLLPMNSMTGFGAATAPFGAAYLHVEISGVNRKQTEISISLPKSWGELEPHIRKRITAALSRGRVNICITVLSGEDGSNALFLNKKKLTELVAVLDRVREVCGQPVQLTTEGLLRLGVMTDSTECDAPVMEVWEKTLDELLQKALQQFLSMRAVEGAHLREELLGRLATLRSQRMEMLQLAAEVPLRHKEALMQRLREHGLALGDDDERLVKELALFADKCDVSEEMARLDSHFNQFEELCNSTQPVGRTLDFLCQEIFREINTIGSKSNSARLAQLVVQTKTEVEKIREQVQNIE